VKGRKVAALHPILNGDVFKFLSDGTMDSKCKKEYNIYN